MRKKGSVTALLTAACFILVQALFLTDAGALTLSRNLRSRKIAYDFVRDNLTLPNGGIRTKYKDEAFNYDYPGGSDVLSESQGFMMRYAANVRDEELFRSSLSFVEKNLNVGGILSYRYSVGHGAFATNAAIDDFRIIRALYEAADVFSEPAYGTKAEAYANRLYGTNISQDTLYDFCDYGTQTRNSFLTLCYADFYTMRLLSVNDGRWTTVANSAREIVQKGYLGDHFPMFAVSYNYETETYYTDRIETIQSLLTAINLAEVGYCPPQTLSFVKEKVISKTLFGSYDSDGNALDDHKSPAVYALASILGKLSGDDELHRIALVHMHQMQVISLNSPLYGAYAFPQAQDAFSFDNLCALLALTL